MSKLYEAVNRHGLQKSAFYILTTTSPGIECRSSGMIFGPQINNIIIITNIQGQIIIKGTINLVTKM